MTCTTLVPGTSMAEEREGRTSQGCLTSLWRSGVGGWYILVLLLSEKMNENVILYKYVYHQHIWISGGEGGGEEYYDEGNGAEPGAWNKWYVHIDFFSRPKVTLETMVVMTTAGLMMAVDLTEVTDGQASWYYFSNSFFSKHKLFDIPAISGDMDFGGDFWLWNSFQQSCPIFARLSVLSVNKMYPFHTGVSLMFTLVTIWLTAEWMNAGIPKSKP